MLVLDQLLQVAASKGAGFLTLIDPNDLAKAKLVECAQRAEEGGADAILIGGSNVVPQKMEQVAKQIKENMKQRALRLRSPIHVCGDFNLPHTVGFNSSAGGWFCGDCHGGS